MKMPGRPASRQMKVHAWRPATQLCLAQLTQDGSTKKSAPAVPGEQGLGSPAARAAAPYSVTCCQNDNNKDHVCCGPHLEAYEQGRVGLSQRCEVSASQLECLFDPALLHQLLELAAAGRNTENDGLLFT